jgi:hypothetical protein
MALIPEHSHQIVPPGQESHGPLLYDRDKYGRYRRSGQHTDRNRGPVSQTKRLGIT